MSDFSAYESIAEKYDSSWRSYVGASGASKELQGDQITNRPQKSFFGKFSIKYLRGKTSSASQQTTASPPPSIGTSLRAAIVSKYGETVAAAMDRQFRLTGATKLSEKKISEVLKAVSSSTLPARLNQNNWTIIQKTVEKDKSGLQSDYHSKMVPTAEILRSSYAADGVRGVCSPDYKNEKHSINAWSDTLTGNDGSTLFACVRSGVMAVLDPEKQQKTFDHRLNENILTALHARDGKLPTEGNDAAHPMELSLVDIGLVSNYEWNLSEGRLQTLQFDLIKQANNNPNSRAISYTPPDSSKPIILYVKPNIRTLNIGTQVGDSLYNPNADKTAASIISVLSEAVTFLEDSTKNITPTDRRVIQELYNQCKEMHAQRTYDTENEGDYCAFHARFALLCYKIGITLMIHCKSGNNRTSRVVEESKLLAAEIDDNIKKEMHGRFLKKELVPISGKLSLPRQRTAEAFFIGVGTQEMQEVNAGARGGREYFNVAKRIMNSETIKAYQGVYDSFLKRYTNSNS